LVPSQTHKQAAEIVEDLQAASDQFSEIASSLGGASIAAGTSSSG
jgi:DNA-binding ferritin-like protein